MLISSIEALPVLVSDLVKKKMGSKEKRQKLFDELAVNLSFYTEGKFRKVFGCPICLKVFDSIEHLSDAHIIPYALGGNTVTLTCKDCNSKVGSKIEHYESERAKFNTAFSGKGDNPWRVFLSPKIDSSKSQNIGKIAADMRLIENNNRIEFIFDIVPKRYSPEALNELTKSLESDNASINIEFQSRSGWDRAKLTYLHAAFLFLFSQFGYEWALDPCTQVIREQIQNPEKNLIDFSVIELTDLELLDYLSREQSKITWYLVTEPEEAKGFLIVFSGIEHWNKPIGVWMPLFGCSYEMPKVPTGRIIPLNVMNDHLSTFNFMSQGNRLINYFFHKAQSS